MSSTFKIAAGITLAIALFYGGYYLLNYRYIQPDEIGVRMVNGGNESEAAAITAVADVVKAEAEAKVRIAEARSAAEAMLVTARANAEATRLQQEVLTPLFVQKLWIESWNGVLPTTITGGNTSLMMGIPK